MELSEGKEPIAPHASGKGPSSWLELILKFSSNIIFAQAGGSVLRRNTLVRMKYEQNCKARERSTRCRTKMQKQMVSMVLRVSSWVGSSL